MVRKQKIGQRNNSQLLKLVIPFYINYENTLLGERSLLWKITGSLAPAGNDLKAVEIAWCPFNLKSSTILQNSFSLAYLV